MLKVGLLGGGFHHASSSTWWKHPKYFEYDKGNVQDITFIIDDEIARNINLDCKRKIGWLVESRVAIPDAIREFKAHYKEISESYEFVFTHYKEIYDLAPNFIYLPPHGYWIEEPRIYPKTKLVSMISSTKRLGPGHAFRLNWVDKLKNKIDLYGKGFRDMVKKEEALCDYMFSVTIENDQYETYWTEKILDCFVTGTIPIYHGAPDLSNYFNMDGIITLTDNFDPSMLSESLYHSMKEPMMDNFERALKYDVIEDIIYKYMEHLG